ncbi:hypothetical protein ACJJTC_009401, partial [Scirpophaga incertulas]
LVPESKVLECYYGGSEAGDAEDAAAALAPSAAARPVQKRTRFSVSHDEVSLGNTSDNLEAVSEAASNHSVTSSMELETEDQNDNLSDMVPTRVTPTRRTLPRRPASPRGAWTCWPPTATATPRWTRTTACQWRRDLTRHGHDVRPTTTIHPPSITIAERRLPERHGGAVPRRRAGPAGAPPGAGALRREQEEHPRQRVPGEPVACTSLVGWVRCRSGGYLSATAALSPRRRAGPAGAPPGAGALRREQEEHPRQRVPGEPVACTSLVGWGRCRSGGYLSATAALSRGGELDLPAHHPGPGPYVENRKSILVNGYPVMTCYATSAPESPSTSAPAQLPNEVFDFVPQNSNSGQSESTLDGGNNSQSDATSQWVDDSFPPAQHSPERAYPSTSKYDAPSKPAYDDAEVDRSLNSSESSFNALSVSQYDRR